MISSVVNLFNVDSFQNMTVRYGLLMNIWFVSPPMAFDSSGIMHLSSVMEGMHVSCRSFGVTCCVVVIMVAYTFSSLPFLYVTVISSIGSPPSEHISTQDCIIIVLMIINMYLNAFIMFCLSLKNCWYGNMHFAVKRKEDATLHPGVLKKQKTFCRQAFSITGKCLICNSRLCGIWIRIFPCRSR